MLLMVLLALWVAAWGYSIFFLTLSPDKDGGITRSVGFLGWQGVAGILAFGCWGIGWSFPKGSGIRRVSAVPLVMALALLVVGLGMAMFGS